MMASWPCVAQFIGHGRGVLHSIRRTSRYSRTMHVPVQDMTFVIRSAGERTLPACQALVRELVGRAGGNPDRQVVVIAERPFAAAVRRTFEIGLEVPRAWVVGMRVEAFLLWYGRASRISRERWGWETVG